MAATSLYYGLYAQAGLAMPLAFSEWLSVISYQILAFAIAIYLTYRHPVNSKTRIFIINLATVIIVILYILLNLNTTLVPTFTPTVEKQVLLYISPYFIALPFITLGYYYLKSNKGTMAPLFWLAPSWDLKPTQSSAIQPSALLYGSGPLTFSGFP